MTRKIVGGTTSCGACPNYKYDSGGVHVCALVDEAVYNKHQVAPFCPLPDYPSRIIADMEMTILGLREQFVHGFGLALLTHIATKFRVNLPARGQHVVFALSDKSVTLGLDYITRVSIRPFEVHFIYKGKSYKLLPDASPPEMQMQVVSENAPHAELWSKLALA